MHIDKFSSIYGQYLAYYLIILKYTLTEICDTGLSFKRNHTVYKTYNTYCLECRQSENSSRV